MAQNSSTNPATGGNTTITGSTADDQLSGGGGNDTMPGLAGNDRLSGDAPLPGQWQYNVYDRNFDSIAGQTSLIGDGNSRLIGRGYVDDFNVLALRNTLGGTPATQNRDDFGIIYRSGLQITTAGTYTFGTTSDDGSRIIIRGANNAVVFTLNNDFHQSVATRTGSINLPAGTYSIEVSYWENLGQTAMSGSIAGPGIVGTADLATSSLITTPPLAEGHVDGDDSILGGDGNDTITGGGGNDRLFGGADQDSILGEAGRDFIEGGAGRDYIDGGADNDSIFGDDGNDTVFSDSSNSGSDSIYGGAGDDSLMFGDGDDIVYGGAGNDIIDDRDQINLVGTNLLYGGEGNDTAYAGFGNDRIYGDGGNDSIFGEGGNDSIYGGAGVDTLDGDAGNDRFIYLAGDVETTGGLPGVVPAESIFGGGSNPNNNDIDFDTVDLTGIIGQYGWKRVIIQSVAGSEDGRIEILAAPGGPVIATIYYDDIEDIIRCFTPGTMILTDRGEVAVDDLVPGDLVVTHDNGLQPLRWVGRQHLSRARLMAQPELQPVRIARGAIAGAGPERSMLVSPQHRVLVTGALPELLFGEAEVLVPATHLVGRADVSRALPEAGVTYIHLLFDRHEVVLSDGLWTESFQPAERTLNAMEHAVRAEILALFPGLATDDTAFETSRPSLKAHEARVLFAG